MPPPRKVSPKHRSRRSRSYSPKQSHRRRSRSHSRSPKKRSKSPQRKHYSKARNASRSPHRRSRSPHKKSRSPRRKSRSPHKRSRSPKRRSQSPNYPVKRPADSSGKRTSYRSRSRSRTPTKKLRDDRYHRDDSAKHPSGKTRMSPSPRRQSPSPSLRRRSRSPYVGKAYMDKPSSSKQPLFPVEKKRHEIDSVKIIDMAPPKVKLDKRFQTLEQIAQGGFDFEENITIGIHRGPHHIELDEDVPVNYDFNPKTFIMLFPKRDHSNPIFDRDEIKAFHHDDILDEEAYVEKRTITVKPSEKQRPKWMDEYKITVGQDREGYGDRRMVQDSRSRRPRSRSPDYEPEVRLDPKPDPRYERLYRDQQRQEQDSLMHENIHRNPNDLRYSLNKRKSDTDRDRDRDRERDRDRDRDTDRGRDGGRFDARSKIEARRHDFWSGDSSDRRGDTRDSRNSPGRSYADKRKSIDKSDLPDFKNRPAPALSTPDVWIIGTDVVKDMQNHEENGESFADMLKDNASSFKYHSDDKLKMAGILSAVSAMLEEHPPPQMIVFQCGENDIGVKDKSYKGLLDDVKKIKEKIPNVRLVWSQTLLPLNLTSEQKNHKKIVKSHKKVSHVMMECFNSEELGGCFIFHNLLCKNFKNLHMYFEQQENGKLGLSEMGMKKYLTAMKEALQYFISGTGTVFPFITWPPNNIKDISPENICMLGKEQLQGMTEAQLLQMSIEQIQQLSVDQLNVFSTEQQAWLYCRRLVQNLTPDQVKKFRVKHVTNLTITQINLFLETQSEHLRADVQEAFRQRRKALRDDLENTDHNKIKGNVERGKVKVTSDYLRVASDKVRVASDQVRVASGQVRVAFRGRGRGRVFNRGRGRGFLSSRVSLHKGFRQRDSGSFGRRELLHKRGMGQELLHKRGTGRELLQKRGIIQERSQKKGTGQKLLQKRGTERESLQNRGTQHREGSSSKSRHREKKAGSVDTYEDWDRDIREKLRQKSRRKENGDGNKRENLNDTFEDEVGDVLVKEEKKSPFENKGSSSKDPSLSPWEKETSPDNPPIELDSSDRSWEGSHRKDNKNKKVHSRIRSRQRSWSSHSRDLSSGSEDSYNSRKRRRRRRVSRSSSSGSDSSYSSRSRERRKFRHSRSSSRHRYRRHTRDRYRDLSPYRDHGQAPVFPPSDIGPPYIFPPDVPQQHHSGPMPPGGPPNFPETWVPPEQLTPHSFAPVTQSGPIDGQPPVNTAPHCPPVPSHFQGPPPLHSHIIVEGPPLPEPMPTDGPPGPLHMDSPVLVLMEGHPPGHMRIDGIPGPVRMVGPHGPVQMDGPRPGPVHMDGPRPGPERIDGPRPGPLRMDSPRPGPVHMDGPHPGPIRLDGPPPLHEPAWRHGPPPKHILMQGPPPFIPMRVERPPRPGGPIQIMGARVMLPAPPIEHSGPSFQFPPTNQSFNPHNPLPLPLDKQRSDDSEIEVRLRPVEETKRSRTFNRSNLVSLTGKSKKK